MPLAYYKFLWKMFITSLLATRRRQLIGSINKLSPGMGTCNGWLPSFSSCSFISKDSGEQFLANPSPWQGQCYCHYFHCHLGSNQCSGIWLQYKQVVRMAIMNISRSNLRVTILFTCHCHCITFELYCSEDWHTNYSFFTFIPCHQIVSMSLSRSLA